MFNWAKNAVGITEPVYGPSAIQSVAEQTKETPYTEFTKEDNKWEVMDSTNVETKTFYLMSDSGHMGMAQIIYSNVMGVRTTAQFNAKIYYPKDQKKEHLWASDNISNFTFSPDKLNLKSDNCSMELSEDGKTYTIKSTMSKKCTVNLKITQAAPTFMVGKNGTTNFGTDPAKPWGRMRHCFWPRCQVEGSMMTQEGPVDFQGKGMFSHALQGMKPHFAAAKWNFCNFQSPSYSAILMQFTTPPAYGETVVAVGGIVTENEVLCAGGSPALKVEHTEVKGDPDNDWPEPGAVKFSWEGQTKDGKAVKAELGGNLEGRTDRVDVMGELPKFVKQIVAGTAGTKPYIYQFTPKLTLKLNVDGQDFEEEGQLFMEATFIT